MYKTDQNVCDFLFLFPLQMGVEGTDEGASGAQHSRKLVSFTLSGIKTKQQQKPPQKYMFNKVFLHTHTHTHTQKERKEREKRKEIAVLKHVKNRVLFFLSFCRSTL